MAYNVYDGNEIEGSLSIVSYVPVPMGYKRDLIYLSTHQGL